MQAIRFATLEETRLVAEHGGEVTPESRVIAFPAENGTGADFAVIRPVLEIDIEFAKESPTTRRALFVHELETFMRLSNVARYYFEVPPDDPKWINAVEKWGAQRVWSEGPMYRYRKEL